MSFHLLVGTGMSSLLLWIVSIILFAGPNLSNADVGTASLYSQPYAPTACYGNNPTQFPSSNLFAAAGEGIWDNGAACGRQYVVQCISADVPNTCIPGQTIQVRVVDRAQTSVSRPARGGVTIVLSTPAFRIIGKPPATSMNIEIQQV